MQIRVGIENIEEMRLEQGIDDVELRNEIRALAIGDFVKLTLLAGVRGAVSETLLFRITERRGTSFRGQLTTSPIAGGLSEVTVGSSFAFSADHIHSIQHPDDVAAAN